MEFSFKILRGSSQKEAATLQKESIAGKALDADTSKGLFSYVLGPVYKPEEMDAYFDAYENHDLVRQSIADLVENAFDQGFYVTAKEKRAKDLADEFNEEFGLDDLGPNITKLAVIAGFCPVETHLKAVPESCTLKIVHPKTVKDIKGILGNVESVLQEVDRRKLTLRGEDLAWFCYDPLGHDPRGMSFVRGMINVLNTLNKTTEQVDHVLDRYVSPLGIWKTMQKGRMDTLKEVVQQKEPGEDLFFDDLTPEELAKGGLVEFLTIDPRVPFWDYIQWLYERVYSYTRSNNLIFVRNATEASAKKMDEIVGRHVAFIQRFFKRSVEHFWYKPLCKLNGIDETPRLVFGKEKAATAEIQLERFLTAGLQTVDPVTNQPYVSQSQFEDLLLQMGLKLKPEVKKPIPPPQVLQAPQNFDKIGEKDPKNSQNEPKNSQKTVEKPVQRT